MTRFRAYSTDSDSSTETETDTESSRDGEEDKEAVERSGRHVLDSETEEGSQDESSDVADGDQPRDPRSGYNKRKKNAFIEDEEGEIRYAHEVEDSNISPSARDGLTIIPWAQQIGVDAQKMHVMQTSLFRMPEEAAALKIMNQAAPPRRHNLRFPLQPLNRKHSRDSDGDPMHVVSMERTSFEEDIERLRPASKFSRVESSESEVKGNEGAVFDAGLALGFSFRVGWGPGGVLVYLGSLCGPSSSQKSSANSSIVTKTNISTVSSPAEASSLSAKLLQHHLLNSRISLDKGQIPFASPYHRLDFSSFTSLFPSADQSYEAHLFRLGQALFDKVDLKLGKSVTSDIRSRVNSLRRRASLSSWLEDVVKSSVDADLRANPSADVSAVAFILLTGNQTENAVKIAADGNSFKLATLISQSGGDWDFRENLKEQLRIWSEQRIDVHIDEGVRKVYTLLAGIVDNVVEGSRGGGLAKCSDVDVIRDLDWKRVFGLHLWFSEPVDASISQVFQAYQKLSKDAPQRVPPPLPWYLERTSMPLLWNVPYLSAIPDGFFTLIRLHAEPSFSLTQALIPMSFNPSPIDYTMSWHLYIILSRSMGARDLSDRIDSHHRSLKDRSRNSLSDGEEIGSPNTEGYSPGADLIASSYAFQLEALGMIQEAAFVLLHVEHSAGREKAIKELLARSAPKLDDWTTRGVVEIVRIPRSWVNEAKACYALDNGDFYEAYELFLKAGSYNTAHNLAILKLAPDAVLRQDLVLLNDLFTRFLGHPVDGWHLKGQVFLDFIHIMTRLPELLESQSGRAVPDAHEIKEIGQLTKSVSRLIEILPEVLTDVNDIRHCAALTEMVSSLATLLDKRDTRFLSKATSLICNESTRLKHVRTQALARFVDRISA